MLLGLSEIRHLGRGLIIDLYSMRHWASDAMALPLVCGDMYIAGSVHQPILNPFSQHSTGLHPVEGPGNLAIAVSGR